MGLAYVNDMQAACHRLATNRLQDNIDYNDIKLLIKDHTTPGKGKAASVPSQCNQTEHDFENLMFSIIEEQHSKLSLFVKSKTGEIRRRLGIPGYILCPARATPLIR